MKKLIVFLGLLLVVCGCGKSGDKNIVKDLSKKIEGSNAYRLTGVLEIYRNEEKYTYDVDSSYMKGDLFKVDLTNKNNNHEQIILKNKEGVFVITPSLNKSFKFQSDWPYNNSQIYLLQPIINDLNNDKDRTIKEENGIYTITSKVDYSSEKNFKNQKVYIDKNQNITKVEILDENNEVKMSLTISNIDYNAKFDDDYFDASRYQSSLPSENDNQEKSENSKKEDLRKKDNTQNTTTSKIEDIVYPMYVPVDTQLSGQDIVETSSGERVILTFSGESAFTIVQETLNDSQAVNYVYGDPYLILDTVGSITDYSVSWISNGVEYSVVSDTMDIDELLTVAQSINVKAVGK